MYKKHHSCHTKEQYDHKVTMHKNNQNEKRLSLPPEVWGKVMFLHMCVILFTGGAGQVVFPACITGHMTSIRRRGLPTGAVCNKGGLYLGGVRPGDLPRRKGVCLRVGGGGGGLR